MRVTRRLLSAMDVTEARIDRYLSTLRAILPAYGVDTPLRLAHFLAQTLHESGRFRLTTENLNYDAERLLAVFPSKFDRARAVGYAGDPRRIANYVYAGRLGNGSEASGDGYRFRGRGLIQLTGRANYRELSQFVEANVENAPARVATDFAVHSAVFFWSRTNLNEVADTDDLVLVTKRIVGARRGLTVRRRLLFDLKVLLGISPVPVS